MGKVVDFVWGPVMLVLLVGTGIYLTLRLKFLPLRMLGYGIRTAFSRRSTGGKAKGDVSPFAALMTSLAATIGTANIAGVATAIAIGGPGAVFWMWVTALVGMATKYAEAVLAVKYRSTDERGNMRGGPMYALEKGLKNKKAGRFAAMLFALFTVAASFGIGNMAQSNSAAHAAQAAFGVNPLVSGIVMAAVCSVTIAGGVRRIASAASRIVPVMGLLYIICGIIVIGINIDRLGEAVHNIFAAAFTGQAAAGAFAGATTMSAIRSGIARGVFSNEAGLGSAPIVAAAARTDHPARQGLVSMTGTFFDTLVVCTITALAIACSDMWQHADTAGNALTGAQLTVAAFDSALAGTGKYIVSSGLALFAFSSIIGWSYYGEKALEYIRPSRRVVKVYRAVFCAAVLMGAVFPLYTVWTLSDAANALMALPNLLCLVLLTRVVTSETRAFMDTIYIHEKAQRKRRARWLR